MKTFAISGGCHATLRERRDPEGCWESVEEEEERDEGDQQPRDTSRTSSLDTGCHPARSWLPMAPRRAQVPVSHLDRNCTVGGGERAVPALTPALHTAFPFQLLKK